ncbi:unnamed protein product [Mytilus edulis]|uniref:Uncharacterized protein n=1 Tax=Mytilus edulis TaxID=6550 RepID=A0A8S3PN50_MYTED|nr:unnamed protein product [Mytilus edulis]
MDCYSSTKNATKMKQEIERNRTLWNRQSTPEAVRLRQVHGLLDAIETGDYIEILKVYYRDQHQHTLNIKDKPLEIPVYIHHNQLDSTVVHNVHNAITSINDVTPGIILYETRIKSDSRIRIGVDFAGDPMIVCTKNGSILDSQHERTHTKPFIHFGKKRNVTKGNMYT